jgi:hypothetical protein
MIAGPLPKLKPVGVAAGRRVSVSRQAQLLKLSSEVLKSRGLFRAPITGLNADVIAQGIAVNDQRNDDALAGSWAPTRRTSNVLAWYETSALGGFCIWSRKICVCKGIRNRRWRLLIVNDDNLHIFWH